MRDPAELAFCPECGSLFSAQQIAKLAEDQACDEEDVCCPEGIVYVDGDGEPHPRVCYAPLMKGTP